MMNNRTIMKNKGLYSLMLLLVLSTSCVKDLDTIPLDKDVVTSATVYDDEQAYLQVLAKIYAGLALSGQEGPNGQVDINGVDAGYGQYLRAYFYLQQFPTDETLTGWDDQTIRDLHYQQWGSSDVFIAAMYYRIFYQISVINEYLRETTPEKLNERGVSQSQQEQIAVYRAEARFMRALSYWHAVDLFGNVPFVTEEDGVGAYSPPQIQRIDLARYIESELLAIESTLMAPRMNEYGRADQACVWMLLSKLYLNWEVYSGGNQRYADCMTYLEKLLGAGYSLESDYQYLFLADNHNLNEVIFSVNFDGTHTKTYGGTTFIIHASIGGSMNPADFGVNGGWGGLRTTSAFVQKFYPDLKMDRNTADSRAMFYSTDQSLEVSDIAQFKYGWAVTKWKNLDRGQNSGSDLEFVDTDFPLFRLADVYLMYAEVVLRGGGGSISEALNYVNLLRERAYGSSEGNIEEASALTLDFILDERARELYWECQRRTDLIRFGQFTNGSYTWEWKGNVQEGMQTSSIYNLFPLPASDVAANLNLKQNTGY
jgi:SusD family.